MGKLIRMGTQERRLLRLRRLHWSRLLFLLGMLIIGSTYQHLRRPRGLPSPWADVSFQQPVKLASRDFPSDRVMVASRDPPEADSEMQDKMLAPQATAGRDEAATLSQTMESTPSMLRRTAKTTPTTPTQENHPSPTAAGTERIKENIPSTPGRELHHYTSSSGRQTVKSYTPAPQREVKSSSPAPARGMVKRYTPPPPAAVAHTSAPSAFVTMRTSHATASRTTVKESQTTATNKVVESSPPERTVQEATRIALKETAEHSPALLMQDVDTNILTSPRSTIKKNPVTTPRRVEKNSATDPFRLGGKKSPTPQGTVREHSLAIPEERVTVSTMTRSSPADPEASTAAWRVRNPMPRTSAPPIRTTSTTVRGLTRKASTAPGTSATPKLRADPTTQVRHCVVVESAPAVPTSSSLGLTTALLPEAPSPSTSIQPPGWPDLHSKAEYPPDLFSVEERQQGWVVLHIFGMMYVFVALAIVCDEYFVPALGVITEKLQISEDVAGATFMAAGGSAPELFTSLIGVFISHSNVGIGTIVGSAVFNILFVIGTCALFSREILNLTWWPLFRDVSFYILDLSMLILFFLDSLIAWWESLLLLLAYALYVFAMKWNKQTELWVKEQLSKRPLAKVMALGDLSKEDVAQAENAGQTAGEEGAAPGEGETGEKSGGEAQADGEGGTEAGGSVCGGGMEAGGGGDGPGGGGEGEGEGEAQTDSEARDGDEGETGCQEANAGHQGEAKSDEKGTDGDGGGDGGDSEEEEEEEDEEEEEEEDEEEEEEEEGNEEPLSLDWPETRQKQAIYLFLLPIVFPLWLTVPDVRRQESRKFFVITFLGSIIWIAMFSYLMVWWAHQVGETIGISEEIMGLTILAAGTSIPDLITSVIVARKGLGDMAVSSSVGSNIFDITVGLPVPWLLFSLINGLQPVPVSSNGLFCAIVLLFLMLLFVISSIASCKWKMNKILGFTMFLLYFVFLIISVMLEDRIISCPVSV
ncbi:sodium/potassium/calcium exchanger 1 isoform X4 [Lepus europaeus]|uniref:sodium/potassium/calcium exchanger 1 isoform X4 n=1 Tax=Lepus europaeus TaxID=9983 RepID=UPI002B48D87B|nr:sodium/potassium/calcium exchanger 1 isoform X4 [Lepus europaeus]